MKQKISNQQACSIFFLMCMPAVLAASMPTSASPVCLLCLRGSCIILVLPQCHLHPGHSKGSKPHPQHLLPTLCLPSRMGVPNTGQHLPSSLIPPAWVRMEPVARREDTTSSRWWQLQEYTSMGHITTSIHQDAEPHILQCCSLPWVLSEKAPVTHRCPSQHPQLKMREQQGFVKGNDSVSSFILHYFCNNSQCWFCPFDKAVSKC